MTLSFWKPGTLGPGSTLDRVEEGDASVISAPPTDSRERLPIFKHRQKLLYCVENYGVSIVVGQTGCGKTTQLPQFLLEAGWAGNGRVIACTQPRRVAATSVAARVAQEVGTSLGEEVGYTIRFEDVSSKERTRILYLTDGMLFRELLVDPLLTRIRRKRPELRIIVSSATMDANYFLDYFTSGSSSPSTEAVIISLEGRMYPVQIAYTEEPVPNFVEKAAQVVWNIHMQGGQGDILMFLPGREDIEMCLEQLAERLPSLPKSALQMDIVPLYAGLSTDEQLRAFSATEKGRRKVVVSTNIAEASVTIEGIRYVIDCGLVKIRVYNPSSGVSSLVVVPASKASASQRAGRAGRTSNGGIDDLMKFEWISAPPAETILKAYDTLCLSGLVTDANVLTPVGSKVAECPLEHNIAKMLFASKEFNCGEEDVFIIPDGAAGALAELERRKFTAEEGDHLTLLNAYNAFVRYGQSLSWCKSHALSFRAMSRAVSIRSQLKKYMHRFQLPIKSCEGDAKRLRQCLVSGYWRHSAKWMPDGTYLSVHGNKKLNVHPTSVLFTRKPRGSWVIYHDIEETKQLQIRVLTEIEPEWLLDYGYKYALPH
ncbi:P-loop containing nucleoside triphosphate hydrolase protein [Coprinellus micaceus]|uniref:P-loop containing nucleoside triphosphate hydrolase protein n=1 Tax=Coprinellus micaceus TaxID=71717 RepID=A0A4Y7TQ52_COPMI|nr:P-loop containing nucleoside triphosphate hydrolase protein [Coprinellus micaceus]